MSERSRRRFLVPALGELTMMSSSRRSEGDFLKRRNPRRSAIDDRKAQELLGTLRHGAEAAQKAPEHPVISASDQDPIQVNPRSGIPKRAPFLPGVRN